MAKYLSKEIVTRVKQLTPTDTAEKKQWYQVGSLQTIRNKILTSIISFKMLDIGAYHKKKTPKEKDKKRLHFIFHLHWLYSLKIQSMNTVRRK